MEQQNNKKLVLICSLVGFGFLMTLVALIVILMTPKEPVCTAHYDFDCDLLCDTCMGQVDTSNPQQHRHVFSVATCTQLSECICGQKTGKLLEHEFTVANCTTPKTCLKCGLEEGDKLGHNWQRNTCDQPEVCITCNTTRGTGIAHMFQDGKCITCNAADPNYIAPHDHIYDNSCDDTCNICNDRRAAGHTWGPWQTITEPTTLSSGTSVRICNICMGTEEKTLPKVSMTLTPAQEEALYDKYSFGIECNRPSCDTSRIVIFDTEFNVYVEFGTITINGCLQMYDFHYQWDDNKYCLVTVENGEIAEIEHSEQCKGEDEAQVLTNKILAKYEGLFECDDTCGDNVVVWDDEFQVYVVFEEDFWEKGMFEVESFFDSYRAEPELRDCVGTIDIQNKTITVTHHSEFQAFYNMLKEMTFTLIGGEEDCDVRIEYENSGVYIMFTSVGNTAEAYGIISVEGATLHCCTGILDLENKTITLTHHDH